VDRYSYYPVETLLLLFPDKGCESWHLTQRKGLECRLTQIKVLSRVLGPQRGTLQERGESHVMTRVIVVIHRNISPGVIKKMIQKSDAHGRGKKIVNTFSWKYD